MQNTILRKMKKTVEVARKCRKAPADKLRKSKTFFSGFKDESLAPPPADILSK